MNFPTYLLWPQGFYCPERTGFDLKGCPEGTYGPDPGYWSVSQCKQCDGGYYCSARNGTAVTGPCQQGYYCSYGNISPTPLLVTAGKHLDRFHVHIFRKYCTAMSHISSLCHVTCCSPLTVLFWECWQTVACSLCHSPGEGGPCPAGHYCPQASIHPLPCPRGTFSNLTKLVSQVILTHCFTFASLTVIERAESRLKIKPWGNSLLMISKDFII